MVSLCWSDGPALTRTETPGQPNFVSAQLFARTDYPSHSYLQTDYPSICNPKNDPKMAHPQKWPKFSQHQFLTRNSKNKFRPFIISDLGLLTLLTCNKKAFNDTDEIGYDGDSFLFVRSVYTTKNVLSKKDWIFMILNECEVDSYD